MSSLWPLSLGWLCALGLYWASVTVIPVPLQADAPLPAPLPLWGNSRTLVYHLPGCRHYPTAAQTSAGRHWVPLRSVQEAEAQGYRQALTCPASGPRVQGAEQTPGPPAGPPPSPGYHTTAP